MAGMKTGNIHRFALCAALLLAACSRGGSEEPSVVLERATAKAQDLRSAAFDARFSYSAAEPAMSLSGTAEGTLADGGRQLSFSFEGDVTMPAEGLDQTVSVAGDVLVADQNETYLRIDRVNGSVLMLPGVGLVPTDMLDTWFLIGSASGTGAAAVTPDPSFLAMQTQTLTVTKDRSYEDVDGHECYAYNVTIDPAKMLAFLERTARERGEAFDRAEAETFLASFVATGTIWIDAESSVIRRITWNFENASGSPDMTGFFTLHFENHDEPVEISPPADAVPFPDPAAPAMPIL